MWNSSGFSLKTIILSADDDSFLFSFHCFHFSFLFWSFFTVNNVLTEAILICIFKGKTFNFSPLRRRCFSFGLGFFHLFVFFMVKFLMMKDRLKQLSDSLLFLVCWVQPLPYLTASGCVVKPLSHVGLFVTPWTVAHQAPPRILEWVAISFSRGSSWSRDRTQVSCIAGRRFNPWATREASLRNWTINPLVPSSLWWDYCEGL